MEDSPRAAREALIIVHLCSLDSFTWHNGRRAAAQLADALIRKISAYDGLIVVLNQSWPLTGYSGARLAAIDALLVASRVVWLAHDEEIDDWDASMLCLGERLRRRGITRLTLGGLEVTPDDASGCVNEVRRQLAAQGFACQIDPTLCGWYADEAAGNGACERCRLATSLALE